MPLFDFEMGGENNDEKEELLKMVMALSRQQRRKLLERGDKSHEEEYPLEMIIGRITFAMAEDQENTEQSFGTEFLKKNTFSKGSFRWLSEPDPSQQAMILLGAMMSMSDPELMNALIKDLGMEVKPFMEFAESQIQHIKDHEEAVSAAKEEAKQGMDSQSAIDAAESYLNPE